MHITLSQIAHLSRMAKETPNMEWSDTTGTIVTPVLKVAASKPLEPIKKERISCTTVDELRSVLHEHHVVEALWMDDGAVACTCTIQLMPQGDFLIEKAMIQSGNTVLAEFDLAITLLPSLALPYVFIEQAAKQAVVSAS